VQQLVFSGEFNSPADRIQALLRDFGNPAACWPPHSPIKLDRVDDIDDMAKLAGIDQD
jgi:hypothetical protein